MDGSRFGLPDGLPADGLDGTFVSTIDCVADGVVSDDSACGGASDGDKSDCSMLDVALFNPSYRIMWIVLIIANAVAAASSIKTAMQFGDIDYNGAKQAAKVGILLTIMSIFIVFWGISFPSTSLSFIRMLG